MTPLQWLAALVAFIAVFAYFVWGLGCRAYASLRAAHTSLRDHRERLRTDIEFAIERKVLNSIKRPRFALWLIKTLVLAAVTIPVILVAVVLVVWVGVSAWTVLAAAPPTVVLLLVISWQLSVIASKLR
jgi:hypothetical protein